MRAPSDAGVKVTATEQLEFAAKLAPHVVPELRAKSLAFAPPSVKTNPPKLFAPGLVNTIVSMSLSVP